MQALGRCIRSPDEKGVLILGDSRYCNETGIGAKNLLPAWIQNEMQVVSSKEIKFLIGQKIIEWGSMRKQNESISSIQSCYADDSSFNKVEARGIQDDLADTAISQNTEIAYTIIGCLEHLQINVGRILLADILSGSKSKKIRGLGLRKSKHYGSLGIYSREHRQNHEIIGNYQGSRVSEKRNWRHTVMRLLG